jgi:uncharacterized protein (DUF433 family)
MSHVVMGKDGFMAGIQKSLRLPPETLREIEEMAKETGRDFSGITLDLLSEAIKMRRCPGIVLSEGVSGRRARVAGTGIEVWEIVANYQSLDEDFARLKKAFHWLTSDQLRTALGYYTAYPGEIDELIARNQGWDSQTIKKRHPLMAPL